MSDALNCDVAVIGAGTAGLAAERAARHNGASTLLIDPEFIGTTCATVGCMPSKLLIAASKARHNVERASVFGVDVDGVTIHEQKMLGRVRSERDRFARLTREAIERIPDGICITSKAKFIGPDRLILDDGREIAAKTIIIATGSEPAMPKIFAELGERVLTNANIFEIEKLSRRLAVIGAGAIGVELAQAFARLGVKVTLLDKGDTLAGIRCPKVMESLSEILRRDMTVHLGADVTPSVTKDGVRLEWKGKSEGHAEFDRILLAVGRPPDLSHLDLDKANLECDDKGVPCHDRATMRCGDSNIFIAGDVAADLPLLHEASHDGAIAGRNAAAYPAMIPTERFVPFSLVFTDPPVASIGRGSGDGIITASADYSDQGRARVEARNEGVVTLYADDKDGKLVGCDLVAPAGEHLAHILAWSMQQGVTASQMLNMPFYHPTIEEGLKQALRKICKATPATIPSEQDAGTPSGG